MKISYIAGLDEVAEADVRSAFLEAYNFRVRMSDVIEKEISSLHLSMESETLYDSANWDKVQVAKIEKIKALRWLQGFMKETL